MDIRISPGIFLLLVLFIININVCAQLKTATLSESDAKEVNVLLSELEKLDASKDKLQIADFYNKIGSIYWDNESTVEAVNFFSKSIQFNIEIGNRNAVQKLNYNIALIYYDIEYFDEAFDYFKESLKQNQDLNRPIDIAYDKYYLALCLQGQKKFKESNKYLRQALAIVQESNDVKGMRNCYSSLAENYEALGETAESMKNYEIYLSLTNELNKKKISEAETKVNNIEKEKLQKEKALRQQADTLKEVLHSKALQEQEIDSLNRMNELRETIIKQQEEKQRVVYFAAIFVGAFLFLLILLFIFVYRQFRQKKKTAALLEQKNAEVELSKKEAEEQRDLANEQKRKITDSIKYAKRIQNAILPPKKKITAVFDDYFIFFKPRDIVSGDFFWFTRKDKVAIIAAADCTGHGVPGAFMSMLGIAFLNEIVNKIAINKHINSLQANDILFQLREQVINSLHQRDGKEESKDGMDIALCIIDYENNRLQYAGAHNPLYLMRDGDLISYAADKMPVSIHRRADQEFTNHIIQLKDNDCLYIFSDGFVDQFGGENGRKYMSKRFKELVKEIHQKPFEEQERILTQELSDWKGEKYHQLDDVLIIGLRYNSKVKLKKADEEHDWSRKRILIVEDIDVNYFLLVEAMSITEVQILRAHNGAEAVEFCQKNEVDLILMDINMPVMDGYEATTEIRKFRKDLPIIAQTAQFGYAEKEKCQEIGFTDFIAKPIELKIFVRIIEKYLFNKNL